MPTANEIRQQFIDFFVEKHGHTFVPSSPVVPYDDPTLLFTNAGMNQFKDVFLGTGKRDYRRAVNSQKCIRAGGKHNDLDDVGKDTYHHTFFEMLGNWSFGDYFKKEAIAWAWELLTKVWGLDKSRLHATVFEGDSSQGLEPDQEAFDLWKSGPDIDPSHIHWGNKKDNFWEMGETGPCGPCSEIHYDRTPDKSGGKLVNAGSADVIEIWNLVFIQFNRGADKKLTPLPAKHVDTGMGFERITAVIQGKTSNYETDVFTPIFQAIQKVTGAPGYTGKLDDLKDTAYRVIADHIRALTFALTDGAMPSNEKRGYVLRRILRRAERYGRLYFGATEPFLCNLVPTVVDLMGGFFPELRQRPVHIGEIIREEERSFIKTLDRGLSQFFDSVNSALSKALQSQLEPIHKAHVDQAEKLSGALAEAFRRQGQKVIEAISDATRRQGDIVIEAVRRQVEPTQKPFELLLNELREKLRAMSANLPPISGSDAFKLHDTYGLYIDITDQMASEAGLRVDREAYEQEMERAKERARSARKKTLVTAVQGELPKTDDSPKYGSLKTQAKVIGWIKDNAVIKKGRLETGDEAALLLDRTNFYAEQGGQVGDVGTIATGSGVFDVEDTQKLGEAILHIGRVGDGWLEVGQTANLEVGGVRADTMRNHTSTHLLNWALRKVLGGEIDQKGSLVDPDKTRFDFTHGKPLTPQEIAEVERLVNEKIYADLPVKPVTMPLADAKKIPGVRAVFGEKYPDPVRVLLIGPEKPEDATPEDSVEFCGGTHLQHTGQAGFFKIVSQEAVGKGVRRVTAVTGREAVATVQRMGSLLDELAGRFSCSPEELPKRLDSLQEEIKKLQQQIKKGTAGDLAGAADKLLASAAEVGGAKVIVGEVPAAPEEQVRQQVDRLRQKAGSCVVVFGWAEDGKVGLIAAVTDDLVKKGIKAGALIGQVAKVVGGGGGGKPTLAQAGGKEPAKLGEALQLARTLVSQQLAG